MHESKHETNMEVGECAHVLDALVRHVEVLQREGVGSPLLSPRHQRLGLRRVQLNPTALACNATPQSGFSHDYMPEHVVYAS